MESTKLLAKGTKKKTLITGSGSGSNSEQMEESRFSRIAVSAYYKAQARGFQPGHELDDWLSAEAEEKQ